MDRRPGEPEKNRHLRHGHHATRERQSTAKPDNPLRLLPRKDSSVTVLIKSGNRRLPPLSTTTILRSAPAIYSCDLRTIYPAQRALHGRSYEST